MMSQNIETKILKKFVSTIEKEEKTQKGLSSIQKLLKPGGKKIGAEGRLTTKWLEL